MKKVCIALASVLLFSCSKEEQSTTASNQVKDLPSKIMKQASDKYSGYSQKDRNQLIKNVLESLKGGGSGQLKKTT